jgi:hypothetical protein
MRHGSAGTQTRGTRRRLVAPEIYRAESGYAICSLRGDGVVDDGVRGAVGLAGVAERGGWK